VPATPDASREAADDLLVRRLVDAAAPAPRTLLLVAHPDDEAIGASALLARLGPAADVAYVTDGAPRAMGDARAAGCASREAYAALRRRERDAALALAGVGPARVHELGAVDQEAWRGLPGLARRVAALADALGAEAVVTHPYEGGHPDHDAAAFAARAAADLLAAGGAAGPAVVECTSYHAAPGAAGAPDDARLVSGAFRALAGAGPERVLALDAGARARKAAMYACHASQARVLCWLPPAAAERFRRAPRYDFSAPPPGGPAWYERLGWPVTAADVARAAAAAREELGLAGAPVPGAR
jgi:LmbE family N-acetylglucosaminyl deacetylase